METLLAFLGGVGVTLTGALIANALTRQRERPKIVEERLFQINFLLMELSEQYFWIASNELHSITTTPEINRRCRDLAWRIADKLRAADELEFLEDILDVLFAPGYDTATKRHDAMIALLNRMEKRVNPRYARKIQEISNANIILRGSGGDSNSPGAPWGNVLISSGLSARICVPITSKTSALRLTIL